MDGNVNAFSYFLPAEEYSAEQVLGIGVLVDSWEPLREAIASVDDPLVLLNEARQIVYCNLAFRSMFPPEDAGDLVGRRIGEVFECRNLGSAPGGCGTGLACRRCRVTGGMLTAMRWGGSQFRERLHVLTEGPEQVPLDGSIESVIVGQERLLFCIIGSHHARVLAPDLVSQAPPGLHDLAVLLASGGPFCPG